MYRYDQYDHQMLADRIKQFRDQTERYISGKLSEAEYLPLRLQNGLYVQRLAPIKDSGPIWLVIIKTIKEASFHLKSL